MVGAVANSPAVVRYQDRCMGQVANQVIQPLELRKRAVPAIMPNHKKGPEHRALHNPEEREKEPGIKTVGDRVESRNDGDI